LGRGAKRGEVVISLDLKQKKTGGSETLPITEQAHMLGERKQPTDRVLR
jgi:hypothetical protein